MFISHVNRLITKHAKIAFICIGIVIIIPFVFFYATPGGGGGSAQPRDVGQMYGKKIKPAEFFAQLTATDVSVLLRWGMLLSREHRMRDFWVNETLKRMRGLREARRRNLDNVSDQEVLQEIQKSRIFQKDGNFSPETFAMFKENFLKQQGLSGEDFDQIIREGIMIERLEAEVVSGVFVSPAEIRQEFEEQGEKFTLKYATFNNYKYQSKVDLKPADTEIQAYFDAHKDELRLPDQKRINAAIFKSADFASKTKVSAQEIKQEYERNKARLYKGKTLEQSQDMIQKRLLSQALAKVARQSAETFSAMLTEARELPFQKAIASFAKTAAEAKVALVASGAFTNEGEIPGIGNRPALQQSAYALTPENPVSGVIRDGDNYVVACLMHVTPGEKPTVLTKGLEKEIAATLTTEMARKFYQSNVEKFREQLADGKTPEMLMQEADEALAKEIETDLMPYFVPVQKKALVVNFNIEDAKKGIKISEKQISDYYEANSEEYKREEVKASHILLRVEESASDKEKAEVKAKLEKIRQEAVSGKDFAALAREHSDDTSNKYRGGDLGYFARKQMVKPFEDAAFALKKGEISPVVETRFGYHLIKLDDRRQGRELKEVSAEISKTLLTEKATEMARAAADDFADKAYDAVEKLTEQSPAKVAEVVREIAVEGKLKVADTDWFKASGRVIPFGYDNELAKSAHQLNGATPFTGEVIKGRGAFYVACWLETKPAYLPKFDDDASLDSRVQYRMKSDKAAELAQKDADEVYAAIEKALAGGAKFEDAAKGTTFTDTPAFSRRQPPSGVPSAADVVEAVVAAKAGTLLKPIASDRGPVLVYLASRELPDDKEFETQKEALSKSLKDRKEAEAKQTFYKGLEEQSATQLAEYWQGKNN
jgi:hypothetical protein